MRGTKSRIAEKSSEKFFATKREIFTNAILLLFTCFSIAVNSNSGKDERGVGTGG